jgi:hypothetical protein
MAAASETSAHASDDATNARSAKAYRFPASRRDRSAAIHSTPNGTTISPTVPAVCAIDDSASARPSCRPGRNGSSVHRTMNAIEAEMRSK